MNVVAFDTETALIRPALQAPPMVCLTWQRTGMEPRIDHVKDAEPRIRGWLEDQNTLLVGHYTTYDTAVICAQFPRLTPLVFRAYRESRITCTKKRQQLLDIAGGVFRGRLGEKGRWITHEYSLDALSRRLRGIAMQKDGWRLEYANFIDVPIAKWPERAAEIQEKARIRRAELPPDPVDKKDAHYDEVRNLNAILADEPEGAIKYPLDDATATLEVYLAQEKHADYLRDQYRQSFAEFALYLSSAWGLRTNPGGVESLSVETEKALAEIEQDLVKANLVREDGTRDTKAAKRLMASVCRANAIPIRRTEGHTKPDKHGVVCADTIGEACEEHVCLDSDACGAVCGMGITAVDSGEICLLEGEEGQLLGQYSEFSTLKKVLSTDVEMLKQGTTYPVHTRYDIAETGRTTSSKPNIQNLRRLPGIREAFVPRDGMVFAQADYPQLELYTLAQCCFSWLGHSKLGEALNAGLDPHLAMAATILGIDLATAKAHKKREDVQNARQTSKVANFGFPGGLGPASLILFARKTYGVTLTQEQARTLKEQWLATWPEMREYFARVNQLFGDDCERASIETLFTERHRGGATYCAACNNGFQALGADCAKRALCLVAEAQYCEPGSPLYGTRTVAFVHDEIIVECNDDSKAHDVALELARLMVDGANEYLKTVPIRLSNMEPTLMRVWSKKAEQRWDVNKRLVPWTP